MSAPQPPKSIIKSLINLQIHINEVMEQGLIDSEDTYGWSQRIRMVQQVLTSPKEEEISRPRPKRALLNFVGELSHVLFGTATDKSVEECRRMIINTQVNQGKIVHKFNEMTSIVNHTYNEIILNRERINDLGDLVASTSDSVEILGQRLSVDEQRWVQIQVIVNVESTLNLLEAACDEFAEIKAKYKRQKASLEIGRLTEELLSPRQLTEALRGIEQDSVMMIDPIQWYYEYVMIEPIWDSDILIYRAKLPLINAITYLAYQFDSWPLPYNTSGYSVQIKTVKHVALDTQSGMIVEPKQCIGRNPVVCRFGIQYNENYFKCERSLLDGEHALRKECKIVIKKSESNSRLYEIVPGEFILSTWGETVTKRCIKSVPIVVSLSAGVYAMNVSANCTYSGEDWIVHPIKEFSGRLSVLSLRVNIKPIKLTEIVKERGVIKLLNNTKFEHLPPVVSRNLQPITGMNYDQIVNDNMNTDMIIIVSLSIILIIVVVVIIAIILYKRFTNKFEESKNRINNDIQDEKCESETSQPLVMFKNATDNEEAQVTIE